MGSVCPTFSVPGMTRSGMILRNRKNAVVVAKEPMPRVSKKFVTAPMPTCAGVGAPASVAGDGFAAEVLTFATAALHPAMKIAVSMPSAACSATIGFIPMLSALRPCPL